MNGGSIFKRKIFPTSIQLPIVHKRIDWHCEKFLLKMYYVKYLPTKDATIWDRGRGLR